MQKDETIAHGKIIAPCNTNGEARTLDKTGKSWLINSASIWAGPAALAVGDVTAATPQIFPVARSEPGPITRSQSMLGYGHLGTVRPLPVSLTQQAASVQSTPVEHVGALHGSTGGLDGGGEEKRIQTSTSVKQSVSTPAGVSAVEPGARRILLDTPKTDACSACSEDDVAPGDAEVLRPTVRPPIHFRE